MRRPIADKEAWRAKLKAAWTPERRAAQQERASVWHTAQRRRLMLHPLRLQGYRDAKEGLVL